MPLMQLTGDETGIAALKALVADNREYLKFLVEEARSNADHKTTFRGKDEAKYSLELNPATGELIVAPVEG